MTVPTPAVLRREPRTCQYTLLPVARNARSSSLSSLLSPLAAWRERRRAVQEAEDAADMAEALRVLSDPDEAIVHWEQVKRELGL